MARFRTLKHEFFTDDYLAEVSPLGRLLFAGLWTIADREGRLEDRPKRIKTEVLPYDRCNVDELLNELAQRDFIIRYSDGNGGRYIQVTKFSVHQRPHPHERSNGYPPPPRGAERKQEIAAQKARPKPQDDEDFAAFWENYPRHEGKLKAAQAWKKVSKEKRELAIAVAAIMKMLVDEGHQEKQFCPMATTFINGERWEDWREGCPPGWSDPKAVRKQANDEMLVAAARRAYDEEGEG